jgi:7,8-dihydropterin-6-yl-methyl-4-(beta-D-ribofuranosyl)aminobenzene 5'-phosphate synthase
MKITALVENQTNCELKARHGLSLYIETQKHKLLFDLGPDNTLFCNAKARGIDLSKVDTVIISHGHIDHGGALKRFLQINSTAKIYVQRKAFEPHYSKFVLLKVSVGIDDNFENHPQVVLVEGDCQIDDELSLFTVSRADKCYSKVNDSLYAKGKKDDFSHEHNLIIRENQTALIMGCGHTGVVNIMKKAEAYHPRLCVGGYHLRNPLTKKTVPTALLKEIAQELQRYPQTQFYTCHCTGVDVFQFLSQQMPNLFYLSCGETIEV